MNSTDDGETAPTWEVERWLNTNGRHLTAEDFEGRVVVAAAFQMLCPSCVQETIPQLRRAHALLPAEHVQVVGLHTVFEHHDAMQPAALAAFLHEYRVEFPVAVDTHDELSHAPITMRRYGMQGTPTLMVFDQQWRLRQMKFGHLSDMELTVKVMALVNEAGRRSNSVRTPATSPIDGSCDEQGCRI